MRRLGCLTPFGLVAGGITLLAVILTIFFTGGIIFSPGDLSAQTRKQTPLGGIASHADLGGNCNACHTSPLSATTMDAQCLDCHSDIQTQRADPTSLHGAIPADQTCRTCHTEHKGSNASLTSASLDNFPHAAVGFALDAHTTTAEGNPFTCADCHTQLSLDPVPAGAYTFERSYCTDCHLNYQAEFVRSHTTDFGTDCLTCHDGVDRYSNFDHNTLTFPLEGKHTEITCNACHNQVRQISEFTTIPDTCIGCHQSSDIHQGAFGSDCATCHTPLGWSDVTFDHMNTNFPLTGAHTTVACASCHINQVYIGTPTDCVSCHAEPQIHLGQFGTNCNACHSTSSWEGATFNHTFPLTHGGEGTIPCATCHTISNDYTSYTCYNCHAHDQAEVLRQHREVNTSDLNNCVECHPTGHEADD